MYVYTHIYMYIYIYICYICACVCKTHDSFHIREPHPKYTQLKFNPLSAIL